MVSGRQPSASDEGEAPLLSPPVDLAVPEVPEVPAESVVPHAERSLCEDTDEAVVVVDGAAGLDVEASGHLEAVEWALPDPFSALGEEFGEIAVAPSAHVDAVFASSPVLELESATEPPALELEAATEPPARPGRAEASVGEGDGFPAPVLPSAAVPGSGGGEDGAERVASVLEQVAERVRHGEIVAVTDANAEPAAVLARVLASLLSARP